MSWEQSHKTMASIWNVKTNTAILLYGNCSLTFLTFFQSQPLSAKTFSEFTEVCRPSLNPSTKSKAWTGSKKSRTMALSAIWCGVTLNKAKQASSYHLEGQATFSERKSFRNFCTIMGSTIWLALINFALKATSCCLKMRFQLFGQRLIMSIEWATWPLWWR